MDKTLLWLIIGGAAVAAVMVAKKAYGLSQLNFKIDKVGPRMDGLSPYLDIDVLVQNPTNSTATVSAFVLDLIYKGQVVANASNYSPVQITEYGETKIVFRFKLSLLTAATTLFSIATGAKNETAQIALKGTITVNDIPVPVTITSNII